MKKVYYKSGVETHRIFFELPECFGCEYIMETNGDPITENDYYTSDAPELSELIAEAISEIMEATEADMTYVMELAESWGIA